LQKKKAQSAPGRQIELSDNLGTISVWAILENKRPETLMSFVKTGNDYYTADQFQRKNSKKNQDSFRHAILPLQLI
jgi:hypothetical protein